MGFRVVWAPEKTLGEGAGILGFGFIEHKVRAQVWALGLRGSLRVAPQPEHLSAPMLSQQAPKP